MPAHSRLKDGVASLASSAGGIVNPSAFAVRELMTSSNLVGSSTGK
jgi:hypothetical protein